MSLHIELRIGPRVVATTSISRDPTLGAGESESDSVNRYIWTHHRRTGHDYPNDLVCRSGFVQHRYGDGAEALAAKVLAELGWGR